MAHLPRLWLKILLFSQGRLPDGYRHGAGGFDEFLITTLGIDRDAFVAYVENEKPDYLTLERWVREHATNLNADAIAKVNERVASADMNDELLAERRARLGIDHSLTNAVAVNDVDDWQAMHAVLTSS
ncbi:MAG TPA: DUF5069 domain-containing protein [Candidatus Elarobacter sp.]|nr:DUF5069 domain-containing protein [Candidatus Elarobacter sp.]